MLLEYENLEFSFGLNEKLIKLIKVISINIHNLLLWVFEIGDAHYIFDDGALAEITVYNSY